MYADLIKSPLFVHQCRIPTSNGGRSAYTRAVPKVRGQHEFFCANMRKKHNIIIKTTTILPIMLTISIRNLNKMH